MSRKLLWQLTISISLVALIIFTVLHTLSTYLTTQLTVINREYQTELTAQAESIFGYLRNDNLLLAEQRSHDLSAREDIWIGIFNPKHRLISDAPSPERLKTHIAFQRKVNWPVHPFMTDVLISFSDPESGYSVSIELPKRMFPSINTDWVHYTLTIVIPSLLLGIFCLRLYRYLMRPIEALNRGANEIEAGNLDARVTPLLPKVNNEFYAVARSFDSMAVRVQELVNSQRQLLGDLSHELRTPLTRLELALDLHEETNDLDEVFPRLKREVRQMKCLSEDALTLAWLDAQKEIDRSDDFNLSTLLNLIIEDAEFEFPERIIDKDYASLLRLENSNHRALAQCIENVIRNALKYSPEDTSVTIQCQTLTNGFYRIDVMDQGPGIEDALLEHIFAPFFRVDKSRSREAGGFGLGLALTKRQIEAIGGQIKAVNREPDGLTVTLLIPVG